MNVAHKLCVHGLPDFDTRLVPDYEVVASTVVQNELLTALVTLNPDALLLDLDEPAAVATILKAVELRPRLGIVGVTADRDIERVLAAQRVGCAQVTVLPLDPDDLAAAVYRAVGHRGAVPCASRTFAVLGSTGGAGSTTIATYLAVEIAQLMKETTALLDLDFECGGVADAFDLDPQYTIADLAAAGTIDGAVLAGACSVLPVGVHIFARPKTIQEAHALDEGAVRRVLQAAQASFPFMVLDLPRHLSPVTGVGIERCSKLLLVLQCTVPGVKNARHMIEVLLSEGVPSERIELVVNRYRKNINSCTVEVVEQQLKRPVLGVVPSDYKSVHVALDTGKPLVGGNPVRTAIRELGARLTGHQKAAKRGTWLTSFGLTVGSSQRG
jgi:pilus assembly protein CpaE